MLSKRSCLVIWTLCIGVVMVLQFREPSLLVPRTSISRSTLKSKHSPVVRPSSVTKLSHWTEKIHLCVMFNLMDMKPKKEVTDLLISYYYPFFRSITLIFDGVNERPEFVPDFVDVINCYSNKGWYQHKCIRSCLHRGTEETKGYLYIADDMYINLTKMADLPTNQLWYVSEGVKNYTWLINPGPEGWHWFWWDNNHAKNLRKVINSLPTEWIEQLKKTAGFPDHFQVKGISDLIYIPQRLVQNITTVLSHIIHTARLQCELATPLAVNIAAPERMTLSGGYLWNEDRENMTMLKQVAKNAHFVHPLKLTTDLEHRRLWTRYMEIQLHNFNIDNSSIWNYQN